MRVSIGLPFYNNEQTLADAIRSVFAQTFQDWELILVNDGSSDGSLEVAQRVNDARVRVVSDGVNRGLVYRLNQIAQLAQGEYIASMHADDLMHPERLERQSQFLDSNPTVELVGTGVYSIDDANNPRGVRALTALDTSPEAVLKRGLFVHPTITGRADWFRRNLYDENFPRAEDLELWCRTCRQNVLAKLQEPLLFYRESSLRSLDPYLQTAHTTRKIYRIYGPSTVGRLNTAFLILESYLKVEVHRVFTALGLREWIIQARNSPLSESERAVTLEILNTILQTPVPGLSSLNSTAQH